MVKCQICEKEIDTEDLDHYELSLKVNKSGKMETIIDPLKATICKECGTYDINIFQFFSEKFKQDVMEQGDYVYVVWYEDASKGIIKNKSGDWWFNSKEAFDIAKKIAQESGENVLVQKGYRVWKINSEGKREGM